MESIESRAKLLLAVPRGPRCRAFDAEASDMDVESKKEEEEEEEGDEYEEDAEEDEEEEEECLRS